MKESDLCLLLEQFYADYAVYKEVPAYGGGRLDMYVKKGPLWVAVEVKKQFSTDLIYQALLHKPYAHLTFVAIPYLKSGYPAQQICKALGIGVMHYNDSRGGKPKWEVLVESKYNRKIVPYRTLETMKQSVAGMQNNSHSEFKVTVALIADKIHRKGGRMLIKNVFEEHFHYSHNDSAKQCITYYCREGVIKEFYIEGKEFVLSPKEQS